MWAQITKDNIEEVMGEDDYSKYDSNDKPKAKKAVKKVVKKKAKKT